MLLKKTTLLSILLLLLGCKQSIKPVGNSAGANTSEMKKFEWLPTPSAPENYPMSIYQGDLITEKGNYIPIPKGGTVNNGWGNHGALWVMGEELKAIPAHLKIIWVSYAEGQFYFGDFKLDQNKISALFDKGYLDSKGKKDDYDTIIVGLAPGGAVSVWVMGAGSSVEVGHYQALKTAVEMADFKPSSSISLDQYIENRQKEFSEETKRTIAEEGIPIGKWTDYRKSFLWKPVFKHADKGVLAGLQNVFYNGELYNAGINHNKLKTYSSYPPSKEISFNWFDKNHNEYACQINFDETEIWSAFKRLFENPKTEQADLVLEMDKYNSDLKISLQSQNDTIRIEKSKLRIFPISK